MPSPEELAIIDSVIEGDKEAYRWLVERYHRGLTQHLYNLMRDADSAEDIAQEAFIRAFDKIKQYNPEYAFSTWLYRIADNLAYRSLKQAWPTADLDDFEQFIPDDKPSLPETLDRQFDSEAVRQAIQALPQQYRRVIALYYWDNFSYDEIAVIIERPVGTVRTWLYRAKEQLRKELHGQI